MVKRSYCIEFLPNMGVIHGGIVSVIAGTSLMLYRRACYAGEPKVADATGLNIGESGLQNTASVIQDLHISGMVFGKDAITKITVHTMDMVEEAYLFAKNGKVHLNHFTIGRCRMDMRTILLSTE